MTRVIAIVAVLVLGACTGIERAAVPGVELNDPAWRDADAGSTATVDHAAWDRFLASYLTTDAQGVNRVAYARVTPEDRAALDAYLAQVQATEPATLGRDEQLAFWINLYNARTVTLILDNYPVASIRDIKDGAFSVGPWGRPAVTVDGRTLSLHDIEHGIVRALWDDPRVHYALNCAAIGCPNLAPVAYAGATLEAELAAAERAYVNDPRGVHLDAERRLVLSKIYVWYREDFGASEDDVLRGLAEITDDPELSRRLAKAPLVFRYVYDWRLNDALP